MNIFFKNPQFLDAWGSLLNKIFFKLIKILKKILFKRKLSFIKKLELINGLFNLFALKFGISKKIFGYFIPIFQSSLKISLMKLGLNFHVLELENL
jgi:hypothetical protein